MENEQKHNSTAERKLSKLIYMSDPALTALVGILGFLETTPQIMGAAIGVTVVSAAVETINRMIETNDSVIENYYEAVEEAMAATKFAFRNRSSRKLLLEKLCAKQLPFDVEMSEAFAQTTSIRDEFKDHPAVQEIISVFDAHFKFAAARRPSLSQFLIIYKTEAIVELLEYASEMANEDRRVINDIHNNVMGLCKQAADIQGISEETQKDVKFLRRLAETGLEVGSKAANWASRSMIVYVLAIFVASVLPFAEITIDLSFFVFVFLSEMTVESMVRAKQIKNPWVSMVVQSAILATLYCLGKGTDFVPLLLQIASVCIAVGAKCFLEWMASMDNR